MKVVFFGTPIFSAEILKYLVDKDIEVVAVVTKEDKAQGRNLKIIESPVKKVAKQILDKALLIQPKKVSTPEFLEQIKAVEADLFIVVAFGQIFPKDLIEMPRYGCINVHTSLLPKYRGAAPIERCIIDGEKVTGTSIMYMVEKLDAGDVLAQKDVIIKDMNAGELTIELCNASKELLVETIKNIESGSIKRVVQDELKVSYAKKVNPEDGEVDFSKSALDICNLVRGVSPKPGAWCKIKLRNKEIRLKLHKVKEYTKTGSIKEIVEYGSNGVAVACFDQSVLIDTLQLEGKKPIKASEFVKGYSLEEVSF